MAGLTRDRAELFLYRLATQSRWPVHVCHFIRTLVTELERNNRRERKPWNQA